MKFNLRINRQPINGTIEEKEGKYLIAIGDQNYQAEGRFISENQLYLTISNKRYNIYTVYDEKKIYLARGSKIYEVEVVQEAELKAVIEHPVDNLITAPMPGVVVKVEVEEGQEVEPGQILVIVEAMKMENQMRSPMKGKIKKVNIQAGAKVDANQVLIELEMEKDRQ